MITIDGSMGEGGGQIVRSSLALSIVTGRPVTIENVRARRKKPGLKRQHLTALRAAARISMASVAGDELGSSRFEFTPGQLTAGDYHFDIGTAGSTMLVLQTILPALIVADGPSRVTFEGGTHNPMAPPFDFLQKAYAPLVERMGPKIKLALVRPGFYPAGGGRVEMAITPEPKLGRLDLMTRGKIVDRRVRAIVSGLPRSIAERECLTATRKLDWPEHYGSVEIVDSLRGPGNVVFVEVRSKNVTEVFTGFGEKTKRAEQVAEDAARQTRRYLKAGVPVGEFLADQLLLPLGIGASLGSGGGQFRTLELSRHSKTHIDVLREFLDIDVTTEQSETDHWKVTVSPPRV
ncbi:MAG: RNA 3'-terminal phosphate cyclase [Planctomycetota bacterium]|nr:RNA 3'-terminal phosphate cyclase [Planctomycetota bacterium]MDA1248044.1 RNA 3'-terminal phosphate cyclase [Planctomycetota bacterium]